MQAARERRSLEGRRPHERHRLHVPRDRAQRGRQRAGLRRLERRDPAEHALRAQRPRPPSTARTPARSSSASSSARTSAARSPACASTRRRRTPARTSAACGRSTGTRLAQVTFTNESASRLADGDVLEPRVDHGRDDLRRVVPRAERPLLGLVRGARRRASTTRRCTPWRAAARRTASTSTASPAASRPTRSTPATTGSTSCSPCPSRVRSSNVAAAEAGATEVNVTWTDAHDRRHADVVPDHAVRRRDRAGATTVAAPATKKKIGGLTTGHTYRFTVQADERQRRRPRLGAVQRGHAELRRSRRVRRRRWSRGR